MRLSGIEHSSAVTGGRDVYVQLGDVSVLLGANDAGKSRTLVALYEILRSLDVVPRRDVDPAPLSTPEFCAHLFLDLTTDELGAACTTPLLDLTNDPDERPRGSVGGVEMGAYDRSWLDELGAADHVYDEGAFEAWLRLARRSAQLTSDHYDPLFEALAAASTAAVLPSEGPDPDLHLALDPITARSEPVAGLLREIGCDLGGEAPVIVLPLGDLFFGFLPTPMWVPKDAGAIQLDLVDAVTASVRAARDIEELRAGDQDEAVDQPTWNLLLAAKDEAGLTVAAVPSLRALCGVAQMVVNEVLPDFVSERYWVAVEPRPIAAWANEGPLSLRIESRDGLRRFRLEEAAEGLQLWLQLAVLESVAALHEVAGNLAISLHHYERVSPPPEEMRSHIREVLDTLAAQPHARRGHAVDPYFRIAALDLLRLVGRSPFQDAPSLSDAAELFGRQLDVATLFGGKNCYFIDEPEQHLHPSTARKAASWLGKVMVERKAQCILTTHSVPFLDLGDEAAYTYLWRDDGRVFSRRFEPSALEAFTVLSEEMGFDRGELLSTVRQLLFVEGRADQIVLETVVGRDLKRLGVTVVPMHGVGRLHRVVEAEALFRFTSAHIRVLLDNDVAGEARVLRSDPDALAAAARNKRRTELQAVAQLLLTARQTEREEGLAILSIPQPDMFFVLDEGVVRTIYPDYPGHASAEDARAAFNAAHRQNIGSKRFREERFGVPNDLGVYAQVAEIMHQQEIVPPALADVVARLADLGD